MLDSLVRVSRRAADNHYANILAEARTSPAARRIMRGYNTPEGATFPASSPAATDDVGLAAASGPGRSPVEHRRQVWLQALPFQQFHVLFNSLSKVLFIFRSLYLCAIGLWPVFSFRRNLPPI